ncbi:MAG: sulfatase-like hydrolase/transferase [Planctomycetaceae bacterium]|nr:sulfatase-like hydrolase/transferase [Planctomycetaceae bacterium]
MRIVCVFLLMLAAGVCPSAANAGAETAQKRNAPLNIVLIFADDQRSDTIGALGNSVIRTPNLDRLVHQGVSFRRAYMQGGMHGATCMPSRAMLLSGQNLFHIDEKLVRSKTWPEAFRNAGYETFASGKWHNGDESLGRIFPEARSMFTGGMTNPLEAKLRDVSAGKVLPAELCPKHACEAFTDEVINFIRKDHSAPFLAYLPFDGPHDPHIVPDDFPVRYSPDDIPLPDNFLPQHPIDNGEMTVRDEQLLPWPRPEHDVRVMLAEYYRYVSFLDVQVGRVLDALEATKQMDNTIVIFAADSGVARGSHGLIGKQNLYEHSVRVPLVISGPGIAKDQTTDALCYLFDLFPTLGARCGVKSPNESDGMDLSPVLADPKKTARTGLMFAYRDLQRAVTDGEWKLIRYPKINRTQLFNLADDPSERTNLIEQAEHKEVQARLLTQLRSEMKASGDNAPLEVDSPKVAEWTPPAEGKKK